VVGVKGKGRSKKTWGKCVGQDLKLLGLKKGRAQDRAEWRGLIRGTVRPVLAWNDGRETWDVKHPG